MGTDGRRSETRRLAAVGLGIGLALLVAGVEIQQRRVERANDLFRRRTILHEYRFDRDTALGTVHESPYAEI